VIRIDRADINPLDDGFNMYGDYVRVRSSRTPLYRVDLELTTDDYRFIERLMDYFRSVYDGDVQGGPRGPLGLPEPERGAPALPCGIIDGVLEDEPKR
jgi:hypothetical protein